ncbi:MAG: tryptophan synthase subunit beta [Candidatus Eremiobacteraeota bacterium]|nr:tryptophan synthase subunit beta [Candidatus Eremiobacteraeota bacterium]
MKAEAPGYFGEFGGRFVPEVFVAALDQLEQAMNEAFADPAFWAAYGDVLRDFVGRPTPVYEAQRFGVGSVRLACKREDLNHTGAHKINNTVGQGLLARRMNKRRLIAETGAGQHGVATATIGAKLGMPVTIFMGATDIERQAPNVAAMQLLGADLRSVDAGTRTLKDATNEAFREWSRSVDDSYYVIGSVVGPHPYPTLVREFQRVIGIEAREQCLSRYGRLPSDVVACVGGGSNAIGIFSAFLDDPHVRLWGVEGAGDDTSPERTAATLKSGSVGVFHGSLSYVLQDADGQIHVSHSISAGLDYPGVGPQHAFLKDSGRVSYAAVSDSAALAAFSEFAQSEGIIPALESAHALAFARRLAHSETRPDLILVNLSGRGEKDVRQRRAC